MSINPGLFTSNTDEWATPQWLFDELDKEFSFTLDVCATPENAKREKFFTISDNGLKQDWSGEICWMNPPYSEPENACKKNCKKKRCKERGYHLTEYKPGQIDWVRKAWSESIRRATVVCLLPARTDTKCFHAFCKWGEVRFLEGRLKFGDSKNSAPFPSMVVIFRPHPEPAQ